VIAINLVRTIVLSKFQRTVFPLSLLMQKSRPLGQVLFFMSSDFFKFFTFFKNLIFFASQKELFFFTAHHPVLPESLVVEKAAH